MIGQAGIVGAGLVGRGWAIVFARAGVRVRVFDTEATVRADARDRIGRSLADMKKFALIGDVKPVLDRIEVVDTLQEAVVDADYVQESVFERVDVKSAVCHEIGSCIRADAVVGSSSSGIPASAFTGHAPRRSRFLIAHPVNPPHLIPVVELVPAPWTDPSIVGWLRGVMEEVGQAPIVVAREIEGFILNRLQAALLNEAWALFDAGLATAADIDKTISHGLGLRWSFMGPFETIDLNAPGGVADYAQRFGALLHSIAASRPSPQPWTDDLIARVTEERRDHLPLDGLEERSDWRDNRLMALLALRLTQRDL